MKRHKKAIFLARRDSESSRSWLVWEQGLATSELHYSHLIARKSLAPVRGGYNECSTDRNSDCTLAQLITRNFHAFWDTLRRRLQNEKEVKTVDERTDRTHGEI